METTSGQRWWVAALLALCMAPLATPAQAQGLCQQAEAINKELQYLRRLSLDLRGKVPSVEEYQAIIGLGQVPDAKIQEMISSDDFRHQMRQYHRALLLADLSQQRFTNNNELRPYALPSGGQVWAQNLGGTRQRQRGFINTVAGEGLCADQQVTLANPIVREVTGDDGARYPLDGWVEVTPWWDRSTTIKVCALDALNNETISREEHDWLYFAQDGTAFGGGGRPGTTPVQCIETDTTMRARTRACGCGPNLQWCGSSPGTAMLRQSTVEQALIYTDSLIADDRPYSDVILGQDAPFNGPLVHWLNHLSFRGMTQLVSDRDHGFSLPNIASDAVSTWRSVDRGAGHAGVLTMPFFLLKWQTDRARANAFYNVFMCNAFSPPTEGLPGADHPSVDEPNLTRRTGCDTCHRALEPMAAYWGRWVEGGFLQAGRAQTNNVVYKRLGDENAACRRESCNQAEHWRCVSDLYDRQTCRLFYNSNPVNGGAGDGYSGQLVAYTFADVSFDQPSNDRLCDWREGGCGYTENVRQGPAALAKQIVESGEFASCTTRRMWGHLVGRDMTRKERIELLPTLQREFQSQDHDLKKLVFTLVTRPEYRVATWAGLE